MSLSFVGPRGSFEERWIVYAQLRDNVWHHLEGGQRSDAFAELYKMGEALGGEPVKVSARAIRAQMQKAVDLLDRPTDDLAISVRTKNAFRVFFASPPDGPETTLARDSGETVPFLRGSPKTLDDVFGDLVEHLIAITEDATEDDVVEVIDM
jgi:hypothetical protein